MSELVLRQCTFPRKSPGKCHCDDGRKRQMTRKNALGSGGGRSNRLGGGGSQRSGRSNRGGGCSLRGGGANRSGGQGSGGGGTVAPKHEPGADSQDTRMEDPPNVITDVPIASMSPIDALGKGVHAPSIEQQTNLATQNEDSTVVDSAARDVEEVWEKYFSTFDKLTRNGRVFNNDSSRRVLTTTQKMSDDEEKMRKDWMVTREAIEDAYIDNRTNPPVKDWESILQMRFAPPLLADANIASTPSKSGEGRARRRYPQKLSVWKDFRCNVSEYCPVGPPDSLDERRFNDAFWFSLTDESFKQNEADELMWLRNQLDRTIGKRSGFLQVVLGSARTGTNCDFYLPTGDKIAVIGEAKTTHNLCLPVDAEQIVESYNKAIEQTTTTGKRSTEWSNVAHPVAQLIGYLIDSQCRFGILTSGTCTYFVYICGKDTDVTFQISDAWFVGEKNYLRAWAYIHHQGCGNDVEWGIPENGLVIVAPVSSPEKQESNEAKHPTSNLNKKGSWQNATPKGQKGMRQVTGYPGQTRETETLSVLLPHVSRDEIDLVGFLGHGKNGTTLKARWNGKEVAIKQFDLWKNGERAFESESTAYAKLRPDWGKLIPTPLFLSESASGNSLFLGLQLGQEWTDNVDAPLSQMQEIVWEIRRKYGIQLLDAEPKNFVLLPGEQGMCLAAIDLEDHEVVAPNLIVHS